MDGGGKPEQYALYFIAVEDGGSYRRVVLKRSKVAGMMLMVGWIEEGERIVTKEIGFHAGCCLVENEKENTNILDILFCGSFFFIEPPRSSLADCIVFRLRAQDGIIRNTIRQEERWIHTVAGWLNDDGGQRLGVKSSRSSLGWRVGWMCAKIITRWWRNTRADKLRVKGEGTEEKMVCKVHAAMFCL